MDSDKSDKPMGSSSSGRGYHTFNVESESSIEGSNPSGLILIMPV